MADEIIEYVIDFTEEDSEPIEIEMLPDDPIEMEMPFSDIFYIAEHRKYEHELSQIDIDNKYVTIQELAEITDKSSIQVFVAQCGIKLQYGIDYIINQYSRIAWSGLLAADQLQPGDVLEIYY